MVMMECPETVNTLLREFFLWQPASENVTRSKASNEEDAPRIIFNKCELETGTRLKSTEPSQR